VLLNFGCRTLVLFKGAGFLTLHSLFPLADSEPFFLRALRVAHGRKTRTLHENREECGTQFWPERPHRGIGGRNPVPVMILGRLAVALLRRKQERRTICESEVPIGNSG
jgi:hypothetical protein